MNIQEDVCVDDPYLVKICQEDDIYTFKHLFSYYYRFDKNYKTVYHAIRYGGKEITKYVINSHYRISLVKLYRLVSKYRNFKDILELFDMGGLYWDPYIRHLGLIAYCGNRDYLENFTREKNLNIMNYIEHLLTYSSASNNYIFFEYILQLVVVDPNLLHPSIIDLYINFVAHFGNERTLKIIMRYFNVKYITYDTLRYFFCHCTVDTVKYAYSLTSYSSRLFGDFSKCIIDAAIHNNLNVIKHYIRYIKKHFGLNKLFEEACRSVYDNTNVVEYVMSLTDKLDYGFGIYAANCNQNYNICKFIFYKKIFFKINDYNYVLKDIYTFLTYETVFIAEYLFYKDFKTCENISNLRDRPPHYQCLFKTVKNMANVVVLLQSKKFRGLPNLVKMVAELLY